MLQTHCRLETFGTQAVTIVCIEPLCLAKDPLKFCGHCRYRESVKSPLSKLIQVTGSPPVEHVFCLPIGRCGRSATNIALEVVVAVMLVVDSEDLGHEGSE